MVKETNADYSRCQNEQQFKMLFIKAELKNMYNDVFCIETEETVKGFPDVMEIMYSGDCLAYFYEFKVSDSSGNIHFQPTQPSFYKAHSDMRTRIVALNMKTKKVHLFSASDLFNDDSDYRINEKAKVSLCKAEK